MRKLLILVVLAILAGCYWFFVYAEQAKEANKIYGNVDIHQVSVAFEASGRIDTIKYREGASVQKDEVLATLDTKQLSLKLAGKRTALAQAQENLTKLKNGSRAQEIAAALAELEQAKAQEHLAQLTFNRKQKVFDRTKGTGISQSELDEAKASLEVSRAAVNAVNEKYKLIKEGSRSEDLRLGELAVEAAQNEVALVEDEISKATLRAPQAGVIRTRLAEVGDMTSSQASVFTLLLNQQKWVRAYVDYNTLVKIKHGASVKLSFAADKQLEGTIGYISDVAEFTPKNVETEDLRTNLVYEIHIEVTDPEDLLRLGMPVTVILE